jgi:hypothetical protein
MKSKFTVNDSPVYVNDHLGAKMEGVPAIGTSRRLNPYCIARAKNPDSVCAQCYAEATINQYSSLEGHLIENTELLTTQVLPFSELPIFGNVGFVRFEAFGDLINETQAINYINIALANPNVNFALWSKNNGIWRRACELAGGKPENMIAVYSANKVNGPEPLPPYFDREFIVWDSEETCNAEGFEINCGARCCAGCKTCYILTELNFVTVVNELLKKRGSKKRK